MINIVHASISENGTAHNGQSGDQTKKEVCIRKWYNKPWNIVLRHPNAQIREKAANIAMLLANSDLVGYDQDNRNSLYEELKKNDFSVSSYLKSNVLTETDCSAFVTACYVCAGVGTLKYTGNAPTTSTMQKVFKAAGFEVLSDQKYLVTDEYLIKGDILLKEGSHTAICLETGARNGNDKPFVDYYPVYKGNAESIVTALGSLNIDYTKSFRAKIAKANNIPNYTGTASQNTKLLTLLKQGYLIIPN